MSTRTRNILIPALLLAGLFAVVVAVPAFAASDFGLGGLTGDMFGLRSDTPASFISGIIQIVLGVLGIVLVVLLVYGGVLYMTSAGNEQRVEMGKKVLTWAIIGLAVVMAAFIIARFVVGALTSGTTSGTGTGTGTFQSGFSEGDVCSVQNDAKLQDLGFYCDPEIGGNPSQGTIRRRDENSFFIEYGSTRDTNLPVNADKAVNE